MKHTLLVFTLVIIMLGSSTASFAADVIAVLDFKSIMADDELGVAVAEILRTELASLGDYTIIERGVLEQILEEQALQSSGAIDSETAAQIGKLLGAKLVVSGSIVKTGDVYTINSRFIDVETGIVKTGQNIRGEGDNEISNMVHQLALVITGRTIMSEEVIATATPQETATATPQPAGATPPSQTEQTQPQANPQSASPPQHLMLFSFEAEDVGKDWKRSPQDIRMTRSQEYASEGMYAAQIVFSKSRTEQVLGTDKIPADWSMYATLDFQAYWATKKSDQRAIFGITVEDANRQSITKDVTVNPGNNRIRFALDEIGQRIDLTRVARLAISNRKSDVPVTIYIDGIQLSTSGSQPPQPGGESQQPARQPAQQPGGGFPQPPQEALTACTNKQAGDRCEITTPQGTLKGTCQQLPNQQLGCAPAGGPQQGNPPQGGPDGQTRPPRR